MGYVRPTTLNDALTCLAEGDMRVAAGCTDLYPATGFQHLPGNILDITAIDALRGVSAGTDHIRIGAATTWTDVLQADLPPGFRHLKQAAREVGSVQIQNAATVGGNLCNASPAADGVPPLLTLDAAVELRSIAATRTIPLTAFINGPRQTALRHGELLTAVVVPQSSARGRSVFIKLGARKYLVISIAMVAARLIEEQGRVAEAAIAVGSCSAVAARLPAAEAILTGQPARPDLALRITEESVQEHIAPISDARGDAAYRSAAAVELVRRAVGGLLSGEERKAA